ncbi:MAG: hypothetical protein ACUVX9_05665 [Anaerolineae bacterium]
MKVTCVARKRSEVSPACQQFADDFAQELRIGATHTVYAQRLAEGCLMYLLDVSGEDGPSFPRWYPAEWFTVADARIPAAWEFGYDACPSEPGGPIAIWGYRDLVRSADHHDALALLEDEARRVFRERKAEIDAEDRAESDHSSW